MPPRRRPNRFPRRVRRLLTLSLARARRRSTHQPRPTLETIVGTAAQLEVQLEQLPSARRAIQIIQEILNEPPIQLPQREANTTPGPEPDPTGSAENPIELDLDSEPDSPLPDPGLHRNLQSEECPICYERPQQVLLNCSGRHSFCGHCPSKIYKRSAKCPLCRDDFNEIAPLYGVPVLELLPLTERCSILPEYELFEMTPAEIPNSNVTPLMNSPRDEDFGLETIEDWDAEYQPHTPSPLRNRPGRNNIFHSFSPPQSSQVQCLGCHAYLNNDPMRILRHSRQCPVLMHSYLTPP